MADTNAWSEIPLYVVHPQPGESMFNTWLRGLDNRPQGHCGPIFIQ